MNEKRWRLLACFLMGKSQKGRHKSKKEMRPPSSSIVIISQFLLCCVASFLLRVRVVV